MNETKLIETKDLREQVINKVEVLDKVKKLFLIPEMEVMTTRMVADYYEVDFSTIQSCYTKNKNEIVADGVCKKKLSDFNESILKNESFNKTQHNISFEFNGHKIIIPNCGTLVFPQRAILRIGMLLRDSLVAKEVRTQLLNTFEHSTDEQKTTEIDEETRLVNNIGIAYASGNWDKLTKANMEYNAYKNRYITKIEDENVKLSDINKNLETTNVLLCRKTMEWGSKPILNALMRKYALNCFSGQYQFPLAWKALYRQVKYKYGWDIKTRSGDKKIINRIKESEFPDVIKVAVGLCEANNIDVGKTINEINNENVHR